MKITNKIEIHLDDKRVISPVNVMQGDSNTRVLEFSLYSGGTEWDIPDGVSVAVAYRRADGAKGAYDTLADGSAAISVANNVVSAVLVPQAIAVAGETKLTVVFTTAAGEQLATFCVVLKVESNPAIGAVEPEDYINLRQVLVEIVDKVMDEMGATGTFRVTVSGESTEELVADKTYAEIYAAHQAGQTVECLMGNNVLPLVRADSISAIFQCVSDQRYHRVTIAANDAVACKNGTYALNGSLPFVWWVNVNAQEDGTYLADRTHTDIAHQYGAGCPIVCSLNVAEGIYIDLPLVHCDAAAVFTGIWEGNVYTVTIDSDNAVTVEISEGIGAAGEDGGHYTPTVVDNGDGTMTVSFTPSDADMPDVEPVTVELPAGVGVSGVRINETDDDRIILHIDLTNGGTNTVAWNKGTPVKGEDYWTEEDKAEIVGEARETVYYATLSQAIADVNNGTQDNAVAKLADANVRVLTGDSGITTVMLLADVSEDAQIDVSKDINLVLSDHMITLSADARLNFGAGTKCSVTAQENGGISKTITDETASALYLAVVYGDSLNVKGGAYTLNGNSIPGCIAFAAIGSCKTFKMDDCTVIVDNTSVDTTGDHVARCIQNQAAKIQVNDSTLTANAQGPAQCIMGLGEMVVNKSILTAYSATHAAQAMYSISGATTITATTITATTGASDSYADGIYNDSGCVLTVRDSKILADAQGVNATTGSLAIACLNLGTAYFENVEANGTHSGIQNNGKIYVSGGKYTGYCHGGFYFAHGVDGVAYINDAAIRCGNYEGVFDYSEMSGYQYGALYIGGGTDELSSNLSAHLDGCTFDPAESHVSIVLRGTNGEQNNTLNISNSTIGGGNIRIDNDTLILNVGVGTDITTDSIDNPSYAEFTDELYRQNHSNKVCNGKDYTALKQFITAMVMGIEIPDKLSEIANDIYDTADMVVTYEDNTTETLKVMVAK